jgi:PKD repeat protein
LKAKIQIAVYCRVSTFVILITLSFYGQLSAQSITVNQATTNPEIQAYVENVLLGSCVTASNITYTGTPTAAGTFDGNGTALGLNSGLLFTSGQANLAVGPDNANTVGFGNGGGGDPDLTVLAGGFLTYDVAILEFDFVPQSDTLRFNYIFGSEEYPEYVHSGYNDVFGFFLSGPGISGPFLGGAENIALIPGTAMPVAIDNINNGYSNTEPSTGPCDNCAYYVDNSSGPAVQYDGHTTVLTAEAVVVPCQTYHIKIAIADAGDGALDSGVFLEEGSFSASGEEAVEMEAVSGLSGVQEGCSVGSFVFRRLNPGNNGSPLTVSYSVSGTATPGTDYTALPGSITIPAGQDSVILNIDAILDFTAEGVETVILDLVGGGCSCTAPPSVSMDILDNDVALSLSTTGTTTICLGESANLTANPDGSIAPYTSGWDNGAPAGNNVTVSPATTTTYTFTVTDACGGQTITSSETVTVVTPDFTVDDDQQCFQGNMFGFTNTGATGGTVSHYWDFGDGNTSTVENPTYSYNSSGNYTVTHYVIYTAAGCTASADASISVFDEPSVLAIIDQNVSCTGGSDGAISTFVTGGTPSYAYDWLPNGETTAAISGLTAGNYTVVLTDANGCSDAVTATVIVDDSELPVALCQDATVQLNAAGFATISATVIDNGSSDNCGIASLVVSPNAFSCAEVGTNPVVLTVTDINGNENTCNAVVTVEDTVPPVAVCQDMTVQLDGSGNASVDATEVNDNSSDNCALQSITLSPNSFDCSNVGPNTVTLTVTDEGGNVSTCDATITVQEDTDPTALCQDISVELDATGNVSITGSQVDGGSSDNCGIADLSVNPSDFDCSNIGDNPVTLVVTDGSGNTATCSATVSVADNLDPTALCQNATVQLDASGNVSITPADVDAGSTDNCAILSMTVSPDAFTCAEIGPNSATLTVVDVNGNSANCNANVTVQDTISPIAVCQDVSVTLDGTGNVSVSAAQVDNGSTDNCAIQTISLTPNSFDCLSAGQNQVELTVTDESGNASTCFATVTVTESNPPTAVCQDITVQLDANGTVTIVGSQVDGGSSDNCGIVDFSVNPNTFTCNELGSNTVILTVTDASGNSDDCSAIVTVEDNLGPSAVCQNITVELDPTGNVTVIASDVDGGSTDNCSIGGFSLSPATFSCTDLGISTAELMVTDGSGNTSTCSADITVEDNIDPNAICQDITVEVDPAGQVTITPGMIDNGSNDACGIDGLSLDVTDFDCSVLGSNSVTLTVTDNSGNTSTCSANVSVEDNISPNAICQNATLYLDGSGAAVLDPLLLDNGSTDNCGIDSYAVSQTDFLCSDIGQMVVTLTVSDASGNTDDCVSVITVIDTVAPIIIDCPSDIVVVPDSSDCSPTVVWNEPVGNDNCDVTLTSDHVSGSNFQPGTTTVTYLAEDPSGNSSTCSFNVTIQAENLLVTTDSPIGLCGYNVSCQGSEDGVATVSATGGCVPYSFLWDNGQTTQTAIGLGAGEHVVVVTDANGIEATDTISLTEPDPISTDSITSPQFPSGTNISCAGGNDGIINLNVLGGSDCVGYDFSWTGPNGFTASTKDILDLEAGTYVITVTDANGCMHVDSITLSEPEPLNIEAFPTTYNGFNVSCFGLSNGSINISVSSGTAPYSYQWSNGETTEDIDSLAAGGYQLTVTDDQGCVSSLPITLTQPDQLAVLVIDTTPVGCNGTTTGQFVVEVNGGVPTYTYLWSNGDTDPMLNGIGAGTYSVVTTDANGCQDSLEVIMTEPTAVDVSIDQVTNATCFGGNDGSVTISASGGNPPYAYSWPASAQSGPSITDLQAGAYIYEVLDASGCEVSDTVFITSAEEIVVVTSNDTTVCPGTVVPLSVDVTGGGGTYLITWDNGQGFGNDYEPYVTQTSNIPVTVIDQNGCEAAPDSVVVTTLNPVNIDFDYAITAPCEIPVSVDFINNSSNAVSYNWTFGDGNSSTQFLPTNLYGEQGVYSVQLVGTSSDGCMDSLVVPVTIDNLPEANFSIPNPNGCYPIMVGLFNQSVDANSYYWDFGDGTTSTDANVYHFYEEAGSYDVMLIAINQNGCSDTLVVDSAVFAYPRPTADFTPIAVSFPEPGNEFSFINNSSGGSEYLWSFGNGEYSELFEPNYSYPDHGSYNIVLRVYNQYGCLDTAMVNIHVDLTSGLFVPNAVAIGEVGEPGIFLPKGAGLGQYHIWVYDLWGNLLWESEALENGSPAEGWNGRYKGQRVPLGSYAWKVNAIFKDGVVWEGMEQSNGKKSNVGSVTVLY